MTAIHMKWLLQTIEGPEIAKRFIESQYKKSRISYDLGRELAAQEITNGTGNLAMMSFEGEVAGIIEADLGMWLSRLKASAPRGRKNASFLPHTASNGVRLVRKYSWNFG